jgi:hypothetical protein
LEKIGVNVGITVFIEIKKLTAKNVITEMG